MASLHRTAGGTYHLRFRYQGNHYNRSLDTDDAKVAKRQHAVIEETLGLVERGVLSPGNHATTEHLWMFLRSGGKSSSSPKVVASVPLTTVCDVYKQSFGATGKEQSTLDTESCHLGHFKRILGNGKLIDTLTPSDVRQYIAKREAEEGTHGRKVRPETIRKELQTLRQVYEFARSERWAFGDNPVSQVKKPRSSQKMPFMAWDEIEQRIGRGGLDEGQVAELWECLFLREGEVGELLLHLEQRVTTLKRFRYIYAALAFCAYTGARRSEMFRCLIDDVKGRTILLREKKKSQERQVTFRQVPLHPKLEGIINEYLVGHPGGQYLFCKSNQKPLDDKTSREAFDAATRRSKWSVLRGYHILRHSFASNLARHRVEQYKIDELMGHHSDVRLRYRHLFPEDRQSAVHLLNFDRAAAADV